MILDIVIFGNPVLKTKCAPVAVVTEEIRTLATDMIDTMRAADGVGLAAPQVGVPYQLAVVDVSEAEQPMTYLRVNGQPADLASISPLVFTNPVLKFPGSARAVMQEGCLSFPELRAQVTRPDAVEATLTLLDGSVIVVETDGLFSRAIQHETDHLNGVLFTERTSATAKLTLKKRIAMMKEDWGDSWKPTLPEETKQEG